MNETHLFRHPAFDFEPDPPSDMSVDCDPVSDTSVDCDSVSDTSVDCDSVGTRGEWQARAALSELLALSFSRPTRSLSIAVTLGDYAKAVDNIFADLGIEPSDAVAEILAEYEGSSDSILLENLDFEYLRLFGDDEPDGGEGTVGAGRIIGADGGNGILSRCESDWREKGADLTDDIKNSVADAYRECGLIATPGWGDPVDHLEAEIEFLEFAALAQVGLVDTNPEAPAKTTGYGVAYRRFMEDHGSKWMPRFAEAVAVETDIPFYRAASLLLGSFDRV